MCLFIRQEKCPYENVGLINYMTFGWLTGYMWGVYRHGVSAIKGLSMASSEKSQESAMRYVFLTSHD